MLKNYFEIDKSSTISIFLKNIGEKKNIHYIVLKGGDFYVDIRTIALRLHNLNERLNNLKKPFSKINSDNQEEKFKLLINSFERVIKSKDNYFDFINGYEYILNSNFKFLNEKVINHLVPEVYALNSFDKISQAKNLFLKKRINILPVIDKNNEIIGELRPIDLLVGNLYSNFEKNKDYFDESKEEGLFSLPIENLMNKKPILIPNHYTYKQALDIMFKKKLPSIIIEKNGELFSILTYKDIFKLVRLELDSEKEYFIEYSGISELYEDDLDLIYDLVEKTMNKISIISNFDLLKVNFKFHGNIHGTHKKKISLNLVLSHGNNIIHVDKQIQGGTSDELSNDKIKSRWNTPQLVAEGLKALERKVIEEKNKNK